MSPGPNPAEPLADLPRAAASLDRMVKRLDSVSADLPETSAQLRQTLNAVWRRSALHPPLDDALRSANSQPMHGRSSRTQSRWELAP